MCGLVAEIIPWTNGFAAIEMEHFNHAMYFNQLRGSDSTGVALINKEGDVTFEKAVGGWGALATSKKYKKLDDLMLKNGKIAFGHGRYATKGEKVEENAHPFERRKPNKKYKIVMIHNGTLIAHQNLPGFNNFKVDSEWLAEQIATIGPEKTFSQVNGAIACMWYDSEFKKFFAYRNWERPLFGVQLATGQYYLNSEEASLWWLKYKFKLEFAKPPEALTPNYIYGWDIKDVREYSRTMVPPRQYTAPPPPTIIRPVATGRSLRDDSDLYAVGRARDKWQNRGIFSDMKNVENYYYASITFEKGGRTTEYNMGCNTFDPNVEPYEPFLYKLRMWDTADDIVEKVFQTADGATKWNSLWQMKQGLFSLYKPVTEVKPTKETIILQKDNLNDGKSLITVPYKAGKVIKFTTMVPVKGIATTIEHQAQCSKDAATMFDWYENNLDGRVAVGERIKMEICHIMPSDTITIGGKRIVRVLGYRIKEKNDEIIDCSFFTDKWTAEELGKMSFFEGVVSFITVTYAKQYEITKSYINIRLTDMVYLGATTNDAPASDILH